MPSIRHFSLVRFTVGAAAVLLFTTRIAVDLYRGYVNYFRWTLDYPRSQYIVEAVTILLIAFARIPLSASVPFLLATGFLQLQFIADSWTHVGRTAHGDDWGPIFVDAFEYFLLYALFAFTVIFHLASAVKRASDRHPA